MSFEDYGRKKYSGQSSNEQSFTDYARGRYGTERGDAYAASQKSKEQISNALNSFVDGYKRRRAEEDAALEAAKAAEKERKRQEELVKYGVKKAGSVTGSNRERGGSARKKAESAEEHAGERGARA